MPTDAFEEKLSRLPRGGSRGEVGVAADPFEEQLSRLPKLSAGGRFARHPIMTTAAALGHLPFKETILPLLGALAGTVTENPELGPVLSRMARPLSAYGRVPFASTIGAATGGGVAGALEEAKQAQERGFEVLPSGSGGRIASSAGLGTLAAPAVKFTGGVTKTGDILSASKLQRDIDVTGGFEKAAPRLRFLRGIISDVAEVPKESGAAVGSALDTLQAAHPERAQGLSERMAGDVEQIREDVRNTPGLQPAMEAAAKFSGSADVVKRLFPEFSIRAGAGEEWKVRLAQQQATATVPISLDDTQRLKGVFARIAFAKPHSPGEQIGAVRLQAMEIWGRFRAHELSVHPELHQEFLRHAAVMENFRHVMPYLKDPGKLMQAMGQLFREDPEAQVGVQELLKESPRTLAQIRHFATASSMQRARHFALGRALRYLIFLPYFRLSSLIFRSTFSRR